MPRSTTVWAAALVLASLSGSGPLLTTAEAMPAPGPQQTQGRPRYYFARHVKRQIVTNATTPAATPEPSTSYSSSSTTEQLSSRQMDFPSFIESLFRGSSDSSALASSSDVLVSTSDADTTGTLSSTLVESSSSAPLSESSVFSPPPPAASSSAVESLSSIVTQAPPPSILLPASAPPKALDLEVTVVSGKHLKNVNWRRGDLRAYAVAYLDPSRRTATRPDDAGGCKPAWNERIVLPLPPHLSPHDPSLLLFLDVFHSKPSDSPKPLVGSARSPLRDLLFPANPNPSSDSPASPIITLPLLRPSGRPQGKLRIRVALRERSPPPPEPQYPPPSSSPYYFPSPPPLTYSAPPQYSLDQYYRPSGYYSAPPPPSQYDYTGGPSAPVEYCRPYEQRGRTEGVPGPYEQRGRIEGVPGPYEQSGRTEGRTASGRYGLGTGLAVGAVAGAVGGLAIDEGAKYKEEKTAESVGEKVAPVARDDYSEYRGEY